MKNYKKTEVILNGIYWHGTEMDFNDAKEFNIPIFLTPSQLNAQSFALAMRKQKDGKHSYGQITKNSVGFIYRFKVVGKGIYNGPDEVILTDGTLEIIDKKRIISFWDGVSGYQPKVDINYKNSNIQEVKVYNFSEYIQFNNT